MLRLAAVACAVLALAACTPRDRNTWHPAPPGGVSPARVPRADEPPPRRFAVVFAPVAIGALAEAYPGAAMPFTYDLADRIDVLGAKADADGLAGADLPASDSATWRAWPVAGTGGADLIVLTSVLSVDRREGTAIGQSGRQISCVTIVEMRALDAYGNVVFHKRGRGEWTGTPSPKFTGPEATAEAKTAWEACSNAVGALLDFLEKRNEAVAGGPAPTAEQLVEVSVDSEPPGADVLIDGIFRGNTPCTLKLPVKRQMIRLERDGYAPWERPTIPDAGMKLRPVLAKP